MPCLSAAAILVKLEKADWHAAALRDEESAGKRLSEKPERTPEEDDMLEMIRHGSNRVSEENLTPLFEWLSLNP